MTTHRNRHTETIVYTSLWLLAAGFYLLNAMRFRINAGLSPLDPGVIISMAGTLIPFLTLFLVNNGVLIPRLLLRNHVGVYFLVASIALIVLWIFQYNLFMAHIPRMPQMHHPEGLRPLLPLPLFIDYTYGLLVIGANLAIALMFQRIDDKLERESLMKTNAESQLTYLKAQINPHFYMNMLNNIHGLIELDPAKAQSMVLDMSRLMRHMLYESSRPLISLKSEITFLKGYLRLMRQRYPENKVSITSNFPSETESDGIFIPPLLYLIFIENAFKHGISYQESSFVGVSLEVVGQSVRFNCINSVHASHSQAAPAGIGLRNVEQRLRLIYGSRATLEIDTTLSAYTVTLTIPTYETPDPNN